ncbi:MAG: hypothetical protein KBA06_02655 [Saprospiraceae bacterium]|nr:hypothetical protein [Saprospiraceae bacterium]
MRIFNIILLFGVALLMDSCYSFKGISITPDLNTFYVKRFELNSNEALPNYAQQFSELLKDKIRLESRLKYNDLDPDIIFSGVITNYHVSAVAPQPGETTAFSRLEVTVSVTYENIKNENLNWTNSFNYFLDFPSNQDFFTVQESLNSQINTYMVEQIFNKAFTNW